MRSSFLHSLTFRLGLLVLIALVPAFLAAISLNQDFRQHLQDESLQKVQTQADRVAEQGQVILAGGRQMLKGLANLPEMRKPASPSVSLILRTIASQSPDYPVCNLYTTTGQIVASSMQGVKPFNAADRPWFQSVLSGLACTQAEYVLDRASGLPVMVLGCPVQDKSGRLVAVMSISTGLGWFHNLAASLDLPPSSTVCIVDARGEIHAHFSRRTSEYARYIPDPQTVMDLVRQGRTILQGLGQDGVQRTYAFSSLSAQPGRELYVRIGIPVADIFAPAQASKASQAKPSVLEPDETSLSPKVQAAMAKAQTGDPHAQNEVGLALATGTGAPKSPAEAVRWWTLAAEKGLAAAQFNLGLAYDQGTLIAQNATLAAAWYEKAVTGGNVPAMYNLAGLAGSGHGVPLNLDKAARLYETAAGHGHVKSMYNLALAYSRGQGLERDDTKAARWMLKAAEAGHPRAQYLMAQMYAQGLGVHKDTSKSAHWLERAAKAGHARAQYSYALHCQQGKGTSQNHAAALHWYKEAAARNHTGAMCNLALILLEGGNSPKNPAEAERLLTKAAEMGDPKAQYNLGVLLLSGHELAKNPEQAYYWLNLAARHGQAEAHTLRDQAAKELSKTQIETQNTRATAFKAKQPGN